MNRMQKLIEARDEILSLMNAIIRQAVTDTGEERELDPEEETAFCALEMKAKQINELIRQEEITA